MNNPIREIIKSNLQKLSKDELVDALANVYMTCPPFSHNKCIVLHTRNKKPNKRSYKPAGKYAAHKCAICRNKTITK